MEIIIVVEFVMEKDVAEYFLQLKGVCSDCSYEMEVIIMVNLVMERDVAEYFFTVARSL